MSGVAVAISKRSVRHQRGIKSCRKTMVLSRGVAGKKKGERALLGEVPDQEEWVSSRERKPKPCEGKS